ncbi:hypothetical protein A3C23_04370 [Candidatus Roizmanbacteria bacterium RIFCSPHIGHO2_02_FULL_37_13b]|uniref:ECF transporter S component n=1 Tax=Candidatus Roizmanbacteria bacterium RIFCSPLOWO2_02_FULL_36_11 TaxID=1802071 RepID=A0A1F7JH62_9BACT|nr:MAG: hypothetical protein A3C23_04370 [Candidatus Roizmanbacteria bacterium RIFCSPHIGHO2_02_FULL_37_13b]OGK54944.1 MAG: hypothetical protein A3H78_00515 [Candidatus Roizmanbacteria bacterium RIFCSPLOWO2_02_FULL_36_11]
MKNKLNIFQKIYLIGIFSIVGFILSQIVFTKLVGSNVSFTLFDFFAPTSGAFLGGYLGIATVLIVNVVNFVIKGAVLSPATFGRLITNLFGVWYFSIALKKKTNYILAIPILAILLFWLNPVGREVWYYALFWTIPIMVHFKRNNLFLKSLGATFTAHAVGGALWIWTMGLPAGVWRSLIPLTAVERLSFALGISASYLIVSHVLQFLKARNLLPLGIQLTKQKQIFS